MNNQAVGTQNMDGITASTYDYKGKAAKNIFSINSGLVTSDVINIGLTFDRKNLTSGGAFLNFLSIQLKRISSSTTQHLYDLGHLSNFNIKTFSGKFRIPTTLFLSGILPILLFL
jgi:hypothetical protein